MKIVGAKLFGQDSAIAILNFDLKDVYAVSADRQSRIKKDNFSIDELTQDKKTPLISDAKILAYPFRTFGGVNTHLETMGTSYFWLKLEAFKRQFYKPRYRSDLAKFRSRKPSLGLIWHFLKSPSKIALLLTRTIFWVAYLNNLLPRSFHAFWVKKIVNNFCISQNMQKKVTVEYHDHQTCHAYSAYYLSPFIDEKDVVVFTLDEQGDEAFSKAFIVRDRQFEVIGTSKVFRKKINGAIQITSIGSLYSNFTEALGFIRSSDEGKVEALAAFGNVVEPILTELTKAIRVHNFSFIVDEKIYWKYNDQNYLEELRQQYGDKDLACTIQRFLEIIVTEYLTALQAKYKSSHLCIAGGVTANVIMNLKIYEKCNFKHIYVCPPMGDEGTALGAAIKSAVSHGYDCDWISQKQMPYYGPSFTPDETKIALQNRHKEINFEFIGAQWPSVAGALVGQNNIIGVFNGRMEFGPRALGNRSIVANPLDPNARDRINNEIKRRHKFQPFCPSVLLSERKNLFQSSFPHKHMAIAFRIKEKYRKQLDSAIHIDGTARPQFVEKQDNPEFFELISTVKKETGFGIVLNTSFNLHGRPVVFNVDHAVDDFLDCGLDYLFINGYKVTRKLL